MRGLDAWIEGTNVCTNCGTPIRMGHPCECEINDGIEEAREEFRRGEGQPYRWGVIQPDEIKPIDGDCYDDAMAENEGHDDP